MDEQSTTTNRRQGTRVFKKSSPNGKVTTYLCKRDFIDSLTHCDPIEGVVLIDPDYIRDRKVFTHVLAAFRYGREDLDVLGLTFRKDLYLASAQVYPCVYNNGDNGRTLINPPTVVATGNANGKSSNFIVDGSQKNEDICNTSRPLTRLQERLMKKLGSNAFPFFFQLPPDAPASVMLQPGPNENGKPCGVDYELRTYVAEASDDKLQKRNSVRLAIRKLTYAPEEPAPQPSAVVVKDFIMSPGSLRLEVSLDKEKYYHGESISVNVLVDNNSNKTVKKIKLSVRQCTELCLHNSNRYACTVDEHESEESFPILPSQTGWCKVYRLRPLLANNRHKRGLALDGKLKHEDTNLASSTIIYNPQQKESLGMIVQYRVKVRLVLGFGSSDVSLELPFTLTHPKPIPEVDDTALRFQECEDDVSNLTVGQVDTPSPVVGSIPTEFNSPTPAGPLRTDIGQNDLINLGSEEFAKIAVPPTRLSKPTEKGDGKTPQDEDDLIFEDFARLRLKAVESESVTTQEHPSSFSATILPSTNDPFTSGN
ncbi:Beta arrestin 1 [Fasciola gigantica]|uniref:Beta arrestin 1 n=1 Tax=Fasciola gigantica TaxID=46835 RepID=A0A504YTI8_FASGI|nr:Beta arrestin 1 [Fasciola gigantica]